MKIAGFQLVDFSKIEFHNTRWNETKNILIIRIRDNQNGQILHNHPKLNRCCKLSDDDVGRHLSFRGKDEIGRISCGIDKRVFLREYVKKRKAVILEGCQNNWPAKNWTFEGIPTISEVIYLEINLLQPYAFCLLLF